MSWLHSWKEGQHLHAEITVGPNTVRKSFYLTTPRSVWVPVVVEIYIEMKERQNTLDAITKRLKNKE